MSLELWKPDFFVTLIQNDAWLELQAHITRGAGETAKGLDLNESLPERTCQDPAMEQLKQWWHFISASSC